METTCPTCTHSPVTTLTHHMLQCANCKFFYVDAAERAAQQAQFDTETNEDPTPEIMEMLKAKYPKDNVARKDIYRNYAKQAFAWYGKDMQALDIGASGGFFLYELEQLGVPKDNLVVNEIDKRYIALTDDYFGYQIERTNIEQYQADRQFDLVTMFDVLEHIDDVAKTLEIIHNCLKPGGRLILKLPNGRFAYTKYRLARLFGRDAAIKNYLYLEPGGHLNYWNCKNIKHLESAGFNLESAHTLRPTKQQFGSQYLPRLIAFYTDRLFRTSLFPEFVAVLRKPE